MTIWDGCSFASRGAVCQATYGIGTAARALLPDGISGASEPAKEVMLPVELVVWKSSLKEIGAAAVLDKNNVKFSFQ